MNFFVEQVVLDVGVKILFHSFRTQSGVCSLIAQAKKKVYDP